MGFPFWKLQFIMIKQFWVASKHYLPREKELHMLRRFIVNGFFSPLMLSSVEAKSFSSQSYSARGGFHLKHNDKYASLGW